METLLSAYELPEPTESNATARQIQLPQGECVGSSTNSHKESTPGGDTLPKSESLDLHLLLVCFVFAAVITRGVYLLCDLGADLLLSKISSTNDELTHPDSKPKNHE